MTNQILITQEALNGGGTAFVVYHVAGSKTALAKIIGNDPTRRETVTLVAVNFAASWGASIIIDDSVGSCRLSVREWLNKSKRKLGEQRVQVLS